MRPRSFYFLLALAAASPAASAQVLNHLDVVHAPASYESIAAWETRAATLRTHILVSSGLYPPPEKTPLRPLLSPPVARDGYTVQSIVLETRPSYFLTGSLFLPAGRQGPFPAILSPHGHWEHGRFEHTNLASIPGRAITLARQGYVVLSYSMMGYNEGSGRFPHRFDDPAYQLWGFSALGLQLWNSLRALDYLAERPDVDPRRIGMTGASGGGTQTFLLTAVDPRIAVAAPVNMISAHFQGGCICENAPSMRLDAHNVEIGALAAPRPLLLISTTGDWTVHTPEVEYPALRSIYRLFGAEDRVANVHLDFPHNYNRSSRDAMYDWFARWLRPAGAGLAEADDLTLAPTDTAHATLPVPFPPVDDLFQGFRTAVIRQLEAAAPIDATSLEAYRAVYRPAFEQALFVPEPSSADRLTLLHPTAAASTGRIVLVVHAGDPADLPWVEAAVARHRAAGKTVATLIPFPEGDTFVPPDSIAYWTTYNASVPARRVAEIRAAIESLHRLPETTYIELVGIGRAGAWTLLAAALNPVVDRAWVDMAEVSYTDDRDFLTHLSIPHLRRAGDLRTAVALLAPIPLDITRLPDGPLSGWISTLYRGLGAETALRLSATE
jgi:dienelactone hydrolase